MTEFTNNQKIVIEEIMLSCDKNIKKFERDLQILPTKRLNLSHKAHLYELFTIIIKTERLHKLIFQAVLKKNKILLPILKERYANSVVDVMHQHEKMVKKNYIPEELFIDYCNSSGETTNNINKLITDVMNEGQQQFRLFAVDEDGNITESNLEDSDEDRYPDSDEDSSEDSSEDQEEDQEDQAPEPIYDVNPNATDVEICASFTNLLS
jgi:hypothetical protein